MTGQRHASQDPGRTATARPRDLHVDGLPELLDLATVVLGVRGAVVTLVPGDEWSVRATTDSVTALAGAGAVGRRGALTAPFASVPIELEGSTVGTLDLYDVAPRAWTATDEGVAALLAAVASACVASAIRRERLARTAEQLQHALESRVLIEQAKGIIAGERGVTVDEAFAWLRSRARDRGELLRDVADAVVNRGLRP